MQGAGFIVNHPAAHGDGVLQGFMRDAELFEGMNAPHRNRQIDRSPADDVAFAWISTPLVKIDIIPAPAQIRGEQAARESAANENEFRRHSSRDEKRDHLPVVFAIDLKVTICGEDDRVVEQLGHANQARISERHRQVGIFVDQFSQCHALEQHLELHV